MLGKRENVVRNLLMLTTSGNKLLERAARHRLLSNRHRRLRVVLFDRPRAEALALLFRPWKSDYVYFSGQGGAPSCFPTCWSAPHFAGQISY